MTSGPAAPAEPGGDYEVLHSVASALWTWPSSDTETWPTTRPPEPRVPLTNVSRAANE